MYKPTVTNIIQADDDGVYSKYENKNEKNGTCFRAFVKSQRDASNGMCKSVSIQIAELSSHKYFTDYNSVVNFDFDTCKIYGGYDYWEFGSLSPERKDVLYNMIDAVMHRIVELGFYDKCVGLHFNSEVFKYWCNIPKLTEDDSEDEAIFENRLVQKKKETPLYHGIWGWTIA